MSSLIFKTAKELKGLVPDFLRNGEAGEGTIKDNMDDLRDILEDEILKSKDNSYYLLDNSTVFRHKSGPTIPFISKP